MLLAAACSLDAGVIEYWSAADYKQPEEGLTFTYKLDTGEGGGERSVEGERSVGAPWRWGQSALAAARPAWGYLLCCLPAARPPLTTFAPLLALAILPLPQTCMRWRRPRRRRTRWT